MILPNLSTGEEEGDNKEHKDNEEVKDDGGGVDGDMAEDNKGTEEKETEEKEEKAEKKEKKTKKPKAKEGKKGKKQKVSLAVTGTQDDGDGWKWDTTLMYYESKDIKHSDKIAAFDYDNTLAKTSLYKKGPDAWSLLFDNIPQKLKELHDQNFKLVIFTNQSEIGKMTKAETRAKYVAEKKGRLSAFVDRIGLPFQIFVATAKEKGDPYRKPAKGMWDYLVANMNGGIKPDMEASFFVGDAAGRKKSKGRPADHSDADSAFAEAIPLKFHTEDLFFK